MYGPRSSTLRLAALLLVAVSLTACGGEDGEGLLPSPTRSITFSPTGTPTLPSRTPRPTETPSPTAEPTPTEEPEPTPTEEPEPTPTEEPEPTPTEEPEPTPTEEPEPTPTEEPEPTPTDEPEPTPTDEPTPTEEPSETARPTESPSPSETADPEEETAADDDEIHATHWWLIAFLLLGAAIAIPLFLWVKRRRRWRADLTACEADLAWLARTLIPELRQKAESPDRAAGGWEVGGVGRATAVEDRLNALEASAPNAAAGDRARALRDAVRGARQRLDGLAGAATPEAVRSTLDAVAVDLETVLEPPPPS